MNRLRPTFYAWLFAGLLSALLQSSASAQSIIQLGLIIDASSSTDDELPTFRDGVADALATLKTDGSLELTLVQFSAEGKVIFGPSIMDSPAVLQEAVTAAKTLDPTFTDIPPINGGTNIEDAFLETLNALQGSANAGNASLQFINMLTDGHPTSHNHLNFSDFNDTVRHGRGQTFAKQQRDALVAAGIDVISFEALGSSPADLDYLKTLTHPGEPAVVEKDPNTGALTFPSPITSQGFLLPIATVNGITDALSAKFAAAGFASTLDPDPLTTVDQISPVMPFLWSRHRAGSERLVGVFAVRPRLWPRARHRLTSSRFRGRDCARERRELQGLRCRVRRRPSCGCPSEDRLQ